MRCNPSLLVYLHLHATWLWTERQGAATMADNPLVLADPLEEGGHGELSLHHRSEEWHPKGCWAMDLVLGRA